MTGEKPKTLVESIRQKLKDSPYDISSQPSGHDGKALLSALNASAAGDPVLECPAIPVPEPRA